MSGFARFKPPLPRCVVCDVALKPVEIRYCAQCRAWLEIGAAPVGNYPLKMAAIKSSICWLIAFARAGVSADSQI